MWEVLDSESRRDLFQTLVFFTFKRDSSVDTDPSSTACHYEVVLVTFSYSYDRPGVSQADRNPAGIKKGKTFCFVLSSKALTRCFPNISGPRVSSETNALACAGAGWNSRTVVCIPASHNRHQHNAEQLLGWTRRRISRETTPALFHLRHPAAQTFLFTLDGAISNPAPGQHLRKIIQSPSRAMFYCYFRFFLVYKAD